jgi:hypothetical protein
MVNKKSNIKLRKVARAKGIDLFGDTVLSAPLIKF